jgi:hypothetical protein
LFQESRRAVQSRALQMSHTMQSNQICRSTEEHWLENVRCSRILHWRKFDVTFIHRSKTYSSGIYKETFVDVFFKENEFAIMKLQRKFTENEFLSYMGGTMGLFAGFSFLTVLELVFYFMFRPAVRKIKCKSKVSPLQAWTKQESPQSNKVLKLVQKSTSYFYHYMEESSLHGLNHASFRNLRSVERIFWSVAFVISMISCGFLLTKMYVRYKNAPVIISFDGDIKNIDKVSFTSRVFGWLFFLVNIWLTKPFFNQRLTKVLDWLIG